MILLGLAGLTGFCVGGERMASIFSVFWGTHPLWEKLAERTRETIDAWSVEYVVPTSVLIAVLVLVAIGAWMWARHS